MSSFAAARVPTALRGERGQLLLGDCLDVVPELVPGAAFDLVYVDPPFNTGLSHGLRRSRGFRARGERAYDDAWGGLDAFLEMLEPRLRVCASVLGTRGCLFLHLDHRTVHDAKVLADRVFGRSAFQGEIVWVPGNGARRKNGPSVSHQTLLVYSKAERMIWNGDDPTLREPYAHTSLRMHFSRRDADGRHFRERRIGGKSYRYYADDGRRLGSVWSDCPAMSANTPFSSEATGYPTQKPEALLERIVRVASRPTGRVLDPMCGSGTTLAVAARLGRSWVGIDRSPAAFQIAGKRLGLLRKA